MAITPPNPQTSLNIPTPYAFNYHIDQQGQFRGLAFANFRMSQDADAVVAALNGFDVQGRKLRVEYKKVLLPPEKERIEREKAMRRMRSMQLEKEREAYQRTSNGPQDWDEFGPVQSMMQGMPQPSLGPPIGALSGGSVAGMSPPPMLNNMGTGSPPGIRTYGQALGMPTSHSGMSIPQLPTLSGQQQPRSYPSPPLPPMTPAKSASSNSANHELDMNDAATLDIYSRILVFKEDHMRDELAFSRSLSPQQRRIVHLVAQRLGVYHYSVGEGEERYAVVTRIPREDAPRQPSLRIPGAEAPRQPSGMRPKNLHRSPSGYLQGPPPVMPRTSDAQEGSTLSAPRGLHSRPSMPNMSLFQRQQQTAHQLDSQSRLMSRPSNGNMHERYATVGPSPRRRENNFGLFGPTNGGNDLGIPPVPTLPSIPSLNGESGVMRQPRGPASGAGGFARRPTVEGRQGVMGSHSAATSPVVGLETQTHDPLEM